jgi:hypothetical protein
MLRRIAGATLGAALVGGTLMLSAGTASAAQCPTTSPQYPAQTCGLSTDKSSAAAGANVVVAGTGFSKTCGVTIALDNKSIGTGKTDGTGAFSQSVTIPADTTAGAHSLTASDQCSSFVLGEQFTVTAASGSGLPFTGFVFWPLLGGGAGLVIGGAALIAAGRRRRGSAPVAA